MHWLDWILVVIPLLIVVWLGVKSQKYVKGVADFLAAGRVAGRYVICVANGEAASGLISVVALIEMYYNCGFAVSFWSKISGPLSLLFALTGYCVYRFRETKAMTMGQFLEMRYNRAFRIFAAFLQAISGVVNYAIFPAVGARFLIYFLGLPLYFTINGWVFSTFALVMAAFLILACYIAVSGGQITIMVTDCVQGLLSYPMYVLVVVYILWRFNWWNEMAPALENRVAGESFMNPFNIDKLRDFNLVYVLIGVVSTIFNRMSWSGSQGYQVAARDPHEQKIGGLLGSWRGALEGMMYILLAVAAYTYLNHPDFAKEAREARLELAQTTLSDVAGGVEFDAARDTLNAKFTAIPEQIRRPGVDRPLSQKDNLETVYCNTARAELEKVENGGRHAAQTFSTIYGQMLVPLSLRKMLPIGITGIFCAIMIFLMVSTDTTYIHSWGSIIAQDIILPLRNKPFTPEQQLRLLRCCIAFVCAFAFFFSLYFAQVDYILMFFQITGAIWMGGAGPVIVFGLYSRRGNAYGAFTALIVGSSLAVGGIFLQSGWAESVYPFLLSHGWVEPLDAFLRTVSGPLNPYVVWEMNPNKMPINSQELMFIAMASSIILYFVVSLLTSRGKLCNLDMLLHRGIYSESGKAVEKTPFSFGKLGRAILGIDSDYTKGDKILAWSVFIYSLIYGFVAIFLVVVIWNWISPWSESGWSWYFYITNVLVVGVIGAVSTVWFAIGGTLDLMRLFRDLANKEENVLDDGRVIGHVSAADVKLVAEEEAKARKE